MRASFRKQSDRPVTDPSYYGVVTSSGRLLWACEHNHDSRKKAIACSRRHLKEQPTTRRARIRQMRGTWKRTETYIPTDPDDGRPMLSRSYIEHFLQCVQYANDDSPDAAFGSAVHAAIHAYYQLCVARGQESMLSEVDRIVREAYFMTPNGTEPGRYDEARELVYEFVASNPANLAELFSVAGRPALEFDLKADCGWFWLTGRADRIDRIDGDDPDDPPRILRVLDYKTGWDPESRRRKIPNAPRPMYAAPVPHEFQRRTYAMAAFLDPRLNARLESVETAIVYPRNRRDPEIISYEKGELDGWWRDINWALAQRWQQRSGPPTGCAACEYCASRKTCGAATTDAKVVPETIEEAQDIAQQHVRAKQVTAGQSKALRSFMKGRSLMVVGGLEIGFAPPRVPTWKPTDPLGIVNALNAQGLNGAAAMVTWIDAKMIPDDMKAALVEAGVARWDEGDVAWRMRKAGTDEEAG